MVDGTSNCQDRFENRVAFDVIDLDSEAAVDALEVASGLSAGMEQPRGMAIS
jgi:hypothetical protein